LKYKLISWFLREVTIKKTTQPVAFRIVRKGISAAHENDLVLKIVINESIHFHYLQKVGKHKPIGHYQ